MQDEVTVSQADERAVAEFHRQSFETLFATTDADIDAGINRAHTLLCQAFARHRHQAERETLARMEAEIKRLREALDEIRDLPGEINPCNYDHDDACELNRQFCYAITVADRALATRQDAPVTENSHDQ